MVFVLVIITDTPRAKVTRNAGPVKSTTPLMKARAVPASPKRPTAPITIAMTKKSADNSGSHQPSSHENAAPAMVSCVSGSTRVLLSMAPHGMIENVSSTNVNATRAIISL